MIISHSALLESPPVFPDGPLKIGLSLSSLNKIASKAYRPDSHRQSLLPDYLRSRNHV
jgi:hypothetical protein